MSKTTDELIQQANDTLYDNDNQEVPMSSLRSMVQQNATSALNKFNGDEPQDVDAALNMKRAVNFEAEPTGLPSSYYTEIIRAVSTVSQPAAANTKNTVLFDTHVADDLDDPIVQISANGIGRFAKGGPFYTKFIATPSRTASSGTTNIFVQAELSFDGGTTYKAAGSSAPFSLVNSDAVGTFVESSPIYAEAGTYFRMVWATDSADGELRAISPSAALKALGVAASPSAVIAIYTLNGFDYVAS